MFLILDYFKLLYIFLLPEIIVELSRCNTFVQSSLIFFGFVPRARLRP